MAGFFAVCVRLGVSPCLQPSALTEAYTPNRVGHGGCRRRGAGMGEHQHMRTHPSGLRWPPWASRVVFVLTGFSPPSPPPFPPPNSFHFPPFSRTGAWFAANQRATEGIHSILLPLTPPPLGRPATGGSRTLPLAMFWRDAYPPSPDETRRKRTGSRLQGRLNSGFVRSRQRSGPPTSRSER